MADRTEKKSQKKAGDAAAKRQRLLQKEGEKAEDKKKKTSKRSVQAGPRRQPAMLPAQHLAKPGNEHDLRLTPRYQAPDYRGSGKLEGMKAIVTGGDSGIGRAVAVLFAREGADVAVFYLSEHKDADETRQAVEKEGGKCFLFPGDVRDPVFCESAVTKAVKSLGGLDILVNNAAFQLHASGIEEISEERFQETLQTNVGGYFRMAKAALSHMEEGACIINTGSETGILGNRDLLDYSSTKGAIHAFTLSLASNLLERGIRVNAVAPGPVWTPLNPADKPAKDVAKFGKDSAMRRPAQPEEISPAYVFLASPITAAYINGIVLPVMGGPQG